MTAAEFSNQFDVLYNNITSNQAPGLNEYEKSVFLTKAQSELVKNYFLSQSNPKQAGFDGNQKRQIDFSMLIRTEAVAMDFISYGRSNIDPRGYKIKINNDILYIINENVRWSTASSTPGVMPTLKAIRQVVPLSYEEYMRLMSKPFKEPLKNQAWRLIEESSESTGQTTLSIILTSSDKNKFGYNEEDSTNKVQYWYRYVKRPLPIILTDLSSAMGEDLTIDGYDGSSASDTKPSNSFYSDGKCCELSEELHEEILQRAVELAKVAWTATGNDNAQMVLQAGQRSE